MLSNIASIKPSPRGTDIPTQKAAAIAAQTIKFVDNVKGEQIAHVNKKQSAAVNLLAKIWRSVGSSVKGAERVDIESSLKQLIP